MDMNIDSGEYIDIDAALSRIGGNMGLYKKLLGRFIEGEHFEKLYNALQIGDTEEAARQAHSLKGVSANLSLVKVQSSALDLEQKLKNNLDYSEDLDEFKRVFDITLEKITEIVS